MIKAFAITLLLVGTAIVGAALLAGVVLNLAHTP